MVPEMQRKNPWGRGAGECVRGCFLELATTSCSHTMVDTAKFGRKQTEAASSSSRICRSLCRWLLSSIDCPAVSTQISEDRIMTSVFSS